MRIRCFEQVVRVALNEDQITEYDLPPQMGKATDSRASQFVARYGRLIQVELDALPPDVLRGLYQEALDRFWDTSTFVAVCEEKQEERDKLAA